ncbi:ABC transporter permease [Aquimarina sp. ERC-38]|uniref:ABC transporter permease/M1 family aminopeptidase n=1 Tax=Aquimarina sp. ERC-38 TaxID=2949996 RepID=UPI0022456AF5|nr:M1 family aminopeptidase [Aquimarina sp. ERC-38]UZO81998.1 ABC transporter permease [Aquimarina sp. ERC-38]
MKEIFQFELQYRFGRPATWIYCALGFLIAVLISAFDKSGTAEFVNSPNSIARNIGTVSVISLFFYAAIMGVPIYRDQDHKTAQTYFTFPIPEKSYVLGRFLGSFTIVTILNLFVVLGMMIGYAIGMFLERPDYGTYTGFDLTAYVLPFLFILEINAFVVGALFFSLMAFFKKMPIIYLGGISLFVLYSLAGSLLSDIDYQWLSTYLDPFGSRVFSFVKKYWSINELNTFQLPIYGKFLTNRLLWLGFGLLLLGFTVFKFSYQGFLVVSKKKSKESDVSYEPKGPFAIKQVFSKAAERQKLFSLAKIEFLSILKDPIFIILSIIGVIVAIFTIYQANSLYGTPNLPLTRYTVTYISGGILLLSVIILIIYSGEAVHRTRSNKTFIFYDALPISNTSLYASKLTALIGISLLLTLLNVVIGMLYQLFNGYVGFELEMSLTYNFTVVLPIFLATTLLAFFVHVLINNKFLGHFIVIILYVGIPIFMTFAIKSTNPMWSFPSTTPLFLSDISGFGHYLPGILWLNLYWILLTGLLAIIGSLFWTRGFFTGFKERWKLATSRFTYKTALVLAVVGITFFSVAGYSYYNIAVLNYNETSSYGEKLNAEAEKKYGKYLNAAHPQVTDVEANIDIFPEERNISATGTFTVTNTYDKAIDTLMLNIQHPTHDTRITKVLYKGQTLEPVVSDREYRMYFYKLPSPMYPKDTTQLQIEMFAETKGFANSLETEILENGTFFRHTIFPSFHYERTLIDNGVRTKYGLKKLDFINPPRTDSVALSTNLFNKDSHYVTFKATISTAEDQIALAPGKLVKTWKEEGRSFYSYELESKTDLFFNIISARYEVTKDKWISPKGKKVTVEIYHSPKHTRNLDYFIKGVQKALTYCSENFMEYPNSVIRVVEFPAHTTFAQSFATTIPYSEDFGFSANFEKAEDLNYAFTITAHEVGHQWWGHIVTPSNTRGANIISETLAEYVNLMTMKEEYGENSIKIFLKYALDTYLHQRSFSFKPERPIIDVETGQHIWYQKGSMVMYLIQDLIGEDTVNTALKEFLNEYKYFEKGIYPTSEDFYQAIYEVTPDSLKYVVDDGFKEIVLYENRVTKAETKQLPDETFETTFTVTSKKTYYDDTGKEKRVDSTANYIDIGVFGEDIEDEQEVPSKNPFYFKTKALPLGESTFTVVTKQKPVKAGIDPYNKLIDRNSDDNLMFVEEK